MNIPKWLLTPLLALGVVLNFITLSFSAVAIPVTVQTEASANNAGAGESSVTIQSSALITVVVADASGKLVSNLGNNSGFGNILIPLPPGWTIRTIATPSGTPSEKCELSPTQFLNQKNGVYLIRVVLSANRSSCPWSSGDYLYTIQFSTPTQDGVALGKLTIR